MDHEQLIDRRKALRKFGRVGLAATAAAGLAVLVERPATASACGYDYFILCTGCCTIKCPSGYFCYQARHGGNGGNYYCCRSGGQEVICTCTRPTIAQ